jgi:hypothetical protein
MADSATKAMRPWLARLVAVTLAAPLLAGAYSLSPLVLQHDLVTLTGRTQFPLIEMSSTRRRNTPVLTFKLEGSPYVFRVPQLFSAGLANDLQKAIADAPVRIVVPRSEIEAWQEGPTPATDDWGVTVAPDYRHILYIVGLNKRGETLIDPVSVQIEASAYMALMGGLGLALLLGAFFLPAQPRESDESPRP